MTDQNITRHADVTVLEEIADQELAESHGGTTIPYTVMSWALGNDGYVCTLTVECQPNCA